MSRITLQILIVLVLAISVLAQEEKPILIEEVVGNDNLESIAARLDNLIYELSKRPNTKAIVKISTRNENCFLCDYWRGSLIYAYLKNTRKVSPEKYSIEHCTENEAKLITRFYLLPPTATPPECNKSLEIPKSSALFETIGFFYNDNNLTPLEDSYIDVPMGSLGATYSLSALQTVKNILDESPESKIYVIAYLGTNLEEIYEEKGGKTIVKSKRNLDKKSVARKMLLNARNELIKNGIKPLQIETIEGGYIDDKRVLEFWFVPQGGEIPKPKPTYFPKKKSNKK